jgi:hypothetical protein
MNKLQRVVLILYCLLVVYCCLWVPWHIAQAPASDTPDELRVGYGWLWIGPSEPAYYNESATPDISIIGLRFLAATALATVAFLLSGKWKE